MVDKRQQRPAKASSLDSVGVVTWLCRHGLILVYARHGSLMRVAAPRDVATSRWLGAGWLTVRAGEAYGYHVAALLWLAGHCQELASVWFDCNCRLKPFVLKHLDAWGRTKS